MTKKNKNAISPFLSKILQLDIYGQTFFLTFNGSKKLASVGGFILTIFTFMCIGSYGTYRISLLLDGSNYQVRSAQLQRYNNYSDPDIEYLNDLGFDIAFGMWGEFPAQMGRIAFTIYTVTREVNETTQMAYNNYASTELDFVLCGNDTFDFDDQEELQRKGLSSYYCIENKSHLVLAGNFDSILYKTFEIEVLQCDNATSDVECASEEDQTDYFRENSIQLRLVNQYFDPSEMGYPIKQYIDANIYVPVVLGKKQNMDIHIMKSKAEITGAYPWQFTDTYRFTEIKTPKLLVSEPTYFGRAALAIIRFQLSFTENVYQKDMYSLMRLISELGGGFNAMIVTGKVCMAFFTSHFYYAYVMKGIYQIYKSRDDELYKLDKSEAQSENSFFKNEFMRELMNRMPFVYSFSKQIQFYLCCIMLRRRKDLKQNQNMSDHYYYTVAKSRFVEEFDIIEFYKMMIQFRYLKRYLLHPFEHFCIENQKKEVLRRNNQDNLKEDDDLSYFIEEDPIVKNSKIKLLKAYYNGFTQRQYYEKNPLFNGVYMEEHQLKQNNEVNVTNINQEQPSTRRQILDQSKKKNEYDYGETTKRKSKKQQDQDEVYEHYQDKKKKSKRIRDEQTVDYDNYNYIPNVKPPKGQTFKNDIQEDEEESSSDERDYRQNIDNKKEGRNKSKNVTNLDISMNKNDNSDSDSRQNEKHKKKKKKQDYDQVQKVNNPQSKQAKGKDDDNDSYIFENSHLQDSDNNIKYIANKVKKKKKHHQQQ